jgi:hypothetical protein
MLLAIGALEGYFVRLEPCEGQCDAATRPPALFAMAVRHPDRQSLGSIAHRAAQAPTRQNILAHCPSCLPLLQALAIAAAHSNQVKLSSVITVSRAIAIAFDATPSLEAT